MKQLLLTALAAMYMLTARGQVAISNPATTPDPSAMLDVRSTNRGVLLPRMTAAQRTAIASPATGLMVYETTTNAVWVYNSTAWVQLGSGGGGSQWLTNGTHLYNGNTGNIGINVQAPTERLHIEGSARLDGGSRLLRFETSVAGPSGQFTVNRYAPGIQFIRSDNTVLGKMEYVDTLDFANFLRFYTGPSPINDFTISTGHEVGIGTANALAKLHVVGGADEQLRISAVDPIIQFTDVLGTQDKLGYVRMSGNDFILGTNTANNTGNFIVTTNGIQSIKANPAGNVGIGLGTANPAAKLHVAGNILARNNGEVLRVDGLNPTINFTHNGGITNTSYSFLTQTASELYLGVNGRLHLDATTSVAIGEVDTDGDGYKLAVNGRVVCEELKVKLSQNWPDYVFRNDYKLLPLKDLNNFIRRHGHLPNVPSAATVEKEGLQVGDMQKRLMEKVEELTLYILQLEERLRLLEGAKTPQL